MSFRLGTIKLLQAHQCESMECSKLILPEEKAYIAENQPYIDIEAETYILCADCGLSAWPCDETMH